MGKPRPCCPTCGGQLALTGRRTGTTTQAPALGTLLAPLMREVQARRYVVLRPGPVPRLALLMAQEEED